jgi:hypothetical protein
MNGAQAKPNDKKDESMRGVEIAFLIQNQFGMTEHL